MKINTSLPIELVDITDNVKDEVRKIGIKNGLCVVSTRHTTSTIIINENESGLLTDIIDLLGKLIPPSAGYKHDRIDNNADAHLKAVMLGSSETIPIIEGRLELGTWQRVFFVELDGPRKRNVNITIISQ
ncbi:MAG: YjbQ family protein [Methanosarcinales archaeon]|nr:YjbQ family protein [Methanosarcinales archaeon]